MESPTFHARKKSNPFLHSWGSIFECEREWHCDRDNLDSDQIIKRKSFANVSLTTELHVSRTMNWIKNSSGKEPFSKIINWPLMYLLNKAGLTVLEPPNEQPWGPTLWLSLPKHTFRFHFLMDHGERLGERLLILHHGPDHWGVQWGASFIGRHTLQRGRAKRVRGHSIGFTSSARTAVPCPFSES